MNNLSLTQKFLLCSLKNVYKSSELKSCFITSVLSELVLEDYIELEGKNILKIKKELSNKPYLKPIYELISDNNPIKTNKVFDKFLFGFNSSKHFNHLHDLASESLVEDNFITSEEKKGLFLTSTRYEVANKEVLYDIIFEIQCLLHNEEDIDDKNALLIMLLLKGKVLKKYLPKEDVKLAKDFIKKSKDNDNLKFTMKMIDYIENTLAGIVAAGIPAY